mgnify:FL=1
MAITVLLVLTLGGVAVGISFIANKRKPDTPTVPKFVLPFQLDRNDFENVESDWLLVLFSSDTCDSCNFVHDQISNLTLPSLQVQNVEFPSDNLLHKKYSVSSVPSLLLANQNGVVEWSFAGIPPEGALSDALEQFGIIPPETGQQVEIN